MCNNKAANPSPSTLTWLKVDPEPDRVQREQSGNCCPLPGTKGTSVGQRRLLT